MAKNENPISEARRELLRRLADEQKATGRSPLADAIIEKRAEQRRLEASDEELVDQLIEHLQGTWGDEPCPYCGADEWTVGRSIVAVPFLRADEIQPFFVVTCDRCGNTVFISADAVGLWPE